MIRTYDPGIRLEEALQVNLVLKRSRLLTLLLKTIMPSQTW